MGFRALGPEGAQAMLAALMKNSATCPACRGTIVYEKAGLLAKKVGIEHGELVCGICGSVYRVNNSPHGLFLIENVREEHIEKVLAYAPLGLTRCPCCHDVKSVIGTTCKHCGYTQWNRIRTRIIVLIVAAAVLGGSLLLSPGVLRRTLQVLSLPLMCGYFLSVVIRTITALTRRKKQAAFQRDRSMSAEATQRERQSAPLSVRVSSFCRRALRCR